jgi:hypothetical protein
MMRVCQYTTPLRVIIDSGIPWMHGTEKEQAGDARSGARVLPAARAQDLGGQEREGKEGARIACGSLTLGRDDGGGALSRDETAGQGPRAQQD